MYDEIFNWLKTNGKKIATNNNWLNALQLIASIPESKNAKKAEIDAIALEIRAGCLEGFYNEEVSPGQKLSDLAKHLYDGSNNIGHYSRHIGVYSQLDQENSPIRQYLSKYENADSRNYKSLDRIFSNYTNYFAPNTLIGFVLDGKYSGQGILFDKNKLPFLTDQGTINNIDQNNCMSIIDMSSIGGGYGWETIPLSSLTITKVERFIRFSYLHAQIEGSETTLFIMN